MKNYILSPNFISIFLSLLLFTITINAQNDKIVTITGDNTRSGTYEYQGTRSSYNGVPGVKVRPYYKHATNNVYLYADYISPYELFPNHFEWVIMDGSVVSPITGAVYVGWDSGDMNYPEDCTWWSDDITVINVSSGTAPTVSTLEASLVTTTSGTIGGNVIADGGGTVSERGLCYSSSDNTPQKGETGVTTIIKGAGLGTFTQSVGSLTAGETYYFQAYGINEYGTTYGGVLNFTTPSSSEPNKYMTGVTSPSAANGIYLWVGEYYGKPAWKHQTLDYYIYYSRYGSSFPSTYYWFIDDELKDEHGANNFLFWYTSASASCPSSGWTVEDGTGDPLITDYPQIAFTNGAGFAPSDPSGGTDNNPIGRFYLEADISGATLTAVTINAGGTHSGATGLKLWSSTDNSFNSGSDTQLNSQSDGSNVAFSGFSSSISTSGTYYFVNADLGPAATGTYTLTIGSQSNLTISGGAIASGFSNAPLSSSTLTIAPAIEMNIKGNGTSIADGDIGPDTGDDTNFGNVNITSGSKTNTFTIESLGANTLSLTGSSPYVVITGHTSDFILTSTPSNSIAGGDSTTFDITFNPTVEGLREATVSIANDDSDENPYNFNIQGTGTDPEINVQGNSLDIADGDTEPRIEDHTDFGNMSVDAGLIEHTFTIQNTGNETLTLGTDAASLNGTNSGDFSINSQPATTVAPTGSTTVKVQFNPGASGLRSAELSITNNDTNENPYNFNIRGTGIDINAPSTQAHSVVFSNIHATKFTASWTRGNGDNCAVFISEGTTGSASPDDNITYSADPEFGSGDEIGSSGWFCIYNGTGTTVNVTGLNTLNTYRVMVCEYNEDSGFIRYNTSDATINPANQSLISVMINEIDSDTPGTDSEEFIELYDGGIGNLSLDGLVLVCFNGSDDQSYDAFDLDGYSTDVNGYFVIGSTNIPESDLNFTSATNQVQNGADAVALYFGNDTDFPNDTPVTTTNLIDAVVYDTNDADDAGLLALLSGGGQLNEDDRGDRENHSLQRLSNGSGSLRNTGTFKAEVPTPGEENVALPIISVEGNSFVIADDDNSPDASDHTVFPNVAVDAGSSTRTYTIKNDGIGELTISSVTITGTNNGDFSVTTPPPSSIAANSSETFTATFNPSEGGTRSATININNNDADKTPYNFDIQGTGIDISAPATQAHSIVFTNAGAATLTTSWTRGDGDKCAVFINKGSSGTALPENDINYAAGPKFQTGDEIGSTGWYCAFNGTGNTVDIKGLIPGNTYRVMICEYNEDSGFIRYNISSATDNPANQSANTILINEIDADTPGSDELEFIELYDGGTGNISLEGLVIVLYNGSSNESYNSFDLDGESTDANGYFVIGNSAVSGVDVIFGDGSIQNGADAISLFVGDDTNFTNGTEITTTNLIDAIVYDNGQDDDAELLTLLNSSQSQVNEDGRGDGQNHSLQRILNGTGGLRNTSGYSPQPPTPDAENYAFPEITSASYNYNSNELHVTGNFFVSSDGADNDVDITLLTITGEGNNSYTLASSGNVEISSSTEFTITLTDDDLINVEYLLNKNGNESATSGTDYNLAAADNWLTGSPAGKNIADATNVITVSEFENPLIISTIYDADSGELEATGTNFVINPGSANDIDASLFTFKGEGNGTYTLTNSADIEITSSTKFTIVVSATDKTNLNTLINENGDKSADGTIYNLDAADNWMAGSPAGNNIADATTGINAINVNEPPVGGNETVTSFNNDIFYFSENIFPFSDADGDNFASIRIESLETDGILKYNGTDVTIGLDCPDVSLLEFNPETDETGSPYAEFDFKVIDDKGGYSETSYTMTINVVGIYYQITQISCNGETDGSIFVEIVDGTPDYTFSWSNGENTITSSPTNSINNLDNGTYTLNFKNGDNAEKTVYLTVDEPDQLVANVINKIDVICHDDNYGSILIQPTGGTPPYSVLWSNDRTTFEIRKLKPGTYEATVTDANGCTDNISATILAIDNVPPVAICKDTTIILDNNGMAHLSASALLSESYDNCKISSRGISKSLFDCDDIGTNEVTGKVRDRSGNASECISNITITDNIPPKIDCNNKQVYLNSNGNITVFTEELMSITDNCGLESVLPESLTYNCEDLNSGETEFEPWINEIHYDNEGADVNEFVEIEGLAGTNLDGYNLVFYNGNNNSVYKNVELSGTIPAEADQFGALSFDISGIQNGPADGLALVSPDLTVIEFISYEGALTAVDGPAAGLSSTDIGVEETGATTVGESLQRMNKTDWEKTLNSSPGFINQGQILPVVGGFTVEITATDLYGNFSSCQTTISVLDTLKPNVICRDITVFLDENGLAEISPEMIDNGSSDNCSIFSLTLNNNLFDCNNLGENSVTLSAVDQSGNIGTCNAIVTVADTIPPHAVCHDLTLALNEYGQAQLTPEMVDSGSSDNCNIETSVLNKTIFSCDDLGENIIILNVIDESGNQSSCESLVTVVDNLPPDSYCKNVSIYLDENGQAGLTPEMVNAGSTDNCGIELLEIDKNTFNCNNIGENLITFTATDGSGNSSTCQAVITVNDTINPNAICHDLTIALDENGAAVLTPEMVADGSFDNCNIKLLDINKKTFTCKNIGENTITLTATDNSGNLSSCEAIITIEDTIPPITVCNDLTIYLDENGFAEITSEQVNNGSFDNCDIAYFELDKNTFSCENLTGNKINTVPWINEIHYDNAGADEGEFVEIAGLAGTSLEGFSLIFYNGNSNSKYKTFALSGIIPDETEGFGTLSFNIDGIQNGSADGLALINPNLEVIDFISYEGIINAIDGPASGMSSTDIGVEESGDTPVGASLSKINNSTWVQSQNSSPGSINTEQILPSLEGILVELTATDVNGNSSSCKATITVVDTVPPVAVCQDLTIALDNFGNAEITPEMVNNGSSDNCSISLLTLDKTAFNCENVGENIVTLTVADQSDNLTSCEAIITIIDTIAPNAFCRNLNIALDENGQIEITPEMVEGGSSDNCGNVLFELDRNIFSCNEMGENLLTLTVTDNSENTSTCQATITISDTIPPIAICNDLTIALNENGQAEITPEMVENGSFDNCSIKLIELNQTIFSCEDLGENNITLYVTDSSGNIGTCETKITLIDTIPPVAICKDLTIALDENGQAEITPEMINNGSTDNCSIELSEINKNIFTCENIGENIVTLTVFDSEGNSNLCEATVTVIDTIPPVFMPVADITFDAEPGICSAEISYPGIFAYDNCGAEITHLEGIGANSVFPAGNTKEVYIATDPSGNTDTLTFTVTINKINETPTISSVPDQQIDEDAVLKVELNGISDGDECDEQELSVNISANNLTGISDMEVTAHQSEGTVTVNFEKDWNGEKTIFITVEDELGASTEISFKVTVNPVNDPPFVVNPIPDYEVHAAHMLKIPVPEQLNVIFNDPDRDILSLSATFNGNATVPSFIGFRNDTITVSPILKDTGLVVVELTASDLSGAAACDTFNILVKGYITSIEQLKNELEVKLYPNPNNGILKFKIENFSNFADPKIEIYTVEGKRVKQVAFESSPMEINLQNLVDGNYLFRFISGKTEIVKQFILKKE